MSRFFKCADESWTWKGNQFLSPLFDQHMRTMERDIVAAATSTKKSLTARHRWPNVTSAKQAVIKRMREFDVGYNIDDKNYGAVVYSKELSKEQCLLHLEDSKGTYCRITDQTKRIYSMRYSPSCI